MLTYAGTCGIGLVAFDVTPATLVSMIITDSGVHRPPYDFAGTRMP